MTEFLEKAKVSHLPSHSGDGYSYGGGVILTIGRRSFFVGEEQGSYRIAEEIARRWNTEPHPMTPIEGEYEQGEAT